MSVGHSLPPLRRTADVDSAARLSSVYRGDGALQRGKRRACRRARWSASENEGREGRRVAAVRGVRNGGRAGRSVLLVLAQTRQQLGEVARPLPDVQLRRQDLVPAVA